MLAQNLDQIQSSAFPNATIGTSTTVGEIISKILPYVFTVSGILLLVYLILGGLQLMLSAGDPKKAQSAWSKITNAAIGFLIIFIAYWVVQLVGRVFNISGFGSIFGIGNPTGGRAGGPPAVPQ